MKKTVIENQINFHTTLSNALWEDRVTQNNSLGVSPYTLVYGKESISPLNILLPPLQLAQASQGSSVNILQSCINTLSNLEESKENSKDRFNQHQDIFKRRFDKQKDRKGTFEIGDLVLKWDNLHDEKENTHKISASMAWPLSNC